MAHRLIRLACAAVLALVGALGWLVATPAWAQELQAVPPLTARVTDQTATLSPAQREALEAKLAAFERESGTQIVVLIVGSTQPEDIAAYAYRVADQWKVGRRDVGDGLLVLVAKEDRRVRIEVAKALEGAVPDLAARQIIDNAIRPAFKAGDYAGGLNQGVDQLAARVRGEALPAPKASSSRAKGSGGGLGWDQLAMFFFVGMPILGAVLTGVLGRKLGGLATGGAAGATAWWFGAPLALAGAAGALALLLVGVLGIGAAGRRGSSAFGRHGGAPIIWGGGGGGGSWGSGGGGGFSSGGGGDFGGGGASGDW
jgi:uncharacterized protein